MRRFTCVSGGIAMLGGQESCSRRLVTLWAAMTLVCAAAASANEIIFDIAPVHYWEEIRRTATEIKTLRGKYDFGEDKISLVDSYTFSSVGHTYVERLFAETKEDGLVCEVEGFLGANANTVGTKTGSELFNLS